LDPTKKNGVKDSEREQTELKSALEEQENLRTELIGPELHSAPQQLQKELDKLKRQNELSKSRKDKCQESINKLNEEINHESQRSVTLSLKFNPEIWSCNLIFKSWNMILKFDLKIGSCNFILKVDREI